MSSLSSTSSTMTQEVIENEPIGLSVIDPALWSDEDTPSSPIECDLPMTSQSKDDTSAAAIILPGSPDGDIPTSSTSPSSSISDEDEDANRDETDENIDAPTVIPETPPRNRRRWTNSPLAPFGAQRAFQKMGSQTSPPRPQTSPTGNKLAHQSSTSKYTKLKSKLRRKYERDMSPPKGVMAKTRAEDFLIRQRMVIELRRNLRIPDNVKDAIDHMIRKLPTLDNEVLKMRLQKFSYIDCCEIWRFQYIDTAEFIRIKGWNGKPRDDAETIEYIITSCRNAIGMSSRGGG